MAINLQAYQVTERLVDGSEIVLVSCITQEMAQAYARDSRMKDWQTPVGVLDTVSGEYVEYKLSVEEYIQARLKEYKVKSEDSTNSFQSRAETVAEMLQLILIEVENGSIRGEW